MFDGEGRGLILNLGELSAGCLRRSCQNKFVCFAAALHEEDEMRAGIFIAHESILTRAINFVVLCEDVVRDACTAVLRLSVPKTRRTELPEVPALRKACVLQIARRDRQQLKVYSWKCQIMPGNFIHDWLRYVVWCFLRRAQVMWCLDTVKLTLKSCSNHHIFILWWRWHWQL